MVKVYTNNNNNNNDNNNNNNNNNNKKKNDIKTYVPFLEFSLYFLRNWSI